MQGGINVKLCFTVVQRTEPNLSFKMISNCRLNASPKLRTYTPILSTLCSTTTLHLLFEAPFPLRCFQRLWFNAWLLGLPCQTTDKLEASNASSSRTITSFLSDVSISARYHTNCLTHVIQIFRIGMDYTIILSLQKRRSAY